MTSESEGAKGLVLWSRCAHALLAEPRKTVMLIPQAATRSFRERLHLLAGRVPNNDVLLLRRKDGQVRSSPGCLA
eukprot:5178362-Prymnesium_polylepis.1